MAERRCEVKYDATATHIFEIPPYLLFSGIGIAFASSLFILLLLKYGHNIPRYTKIFLLSGIGLLVGAKFFGCLANLYAALADNIPITMGIFHNAGLVFYGGMVGFLSTFLLLCKIWNKNIDYEVVDLAVVCFPLFHFWGRLACFFAGCCYGMETHSFYSIIYTTYIGDEIVTASRIPIQLIEAGINVIIFSVLIKLLQDQRLRRRLVFVYLFSYAIARLFLEFFRGDMDRGIWNGSSFGQCVSVLILIFCSALIVMIKSRKKTYEEVH